MPAPYSLDFRKKVPDAYFEDASLRKTAERFGVSYRFVQGLVKRYKMEKTIEPKTHKSGNPPKVQPGHVPFLKELLEKENDLSLEEICSRFKERFSTSVSISSMNKSLKRIGITRKKTFYDPKKYNDANIIKWIDYCLRLSSANSEDCVFIDETGSVLNISLLYGRSPEGKRAFAERPVSKGKRISVTGALSSKGLLDCMRFEGTLTGSVFSYYVEHFLVKDLRPGSVVILDNALKWSSKNGHFC